jgi:DNA polymerase-3 subunit gamma/tau
VTEPAAAREPGTAQGPPLALYRKYRPATLAEVKGQEHITEPLRQALLSGRVHHAYLFSGPRGCGKTSTARILARSLNCESGPTPDPCGHCASCVALAPSGPGSIDVIEIDAASHGGVDDARDLRERAFYAPVASRFKVYIVDEAHMVTGGGFNALLKLVEEPPPHLKFVFATTEPDKVIPTIRSRTHHYPFRLFPPAVLRGLLEQILDSEQVPYEPAVLPVVIRAGAGSARDSLSVLDQLIAGSDAAGLSYASAIALLGYTDDRLLDEVAEAFAGGDGSAVFQAIDRLVEAGHDPRRFAADLLERLRDLIVLAVVPAAAATGLLDLSADRLERMQAQAAAFGQAGLTRAAEIISAGLVEMRGATAPRLQLELMCAQVLLPPATADADLLARLERLERRAGPAAAPSRDAAGSAERPPSRAATAPAEPPPSRAAAGPAEPPPSRAAAGPAEPAQPPRQGRPAPAPATSRPAGTQIPTNSASTASPAGPAPKAATGQADTATLRARWADILEAVKDRRRVAWMLLSNARAESLDEGVLTIAFAREGEAKGFLSSGYDAELRRVLEVMFGVSPQIRAIATGAPPPGQGNDPGGRAAAGGPPADGVSHGVGGAGSYGASGTAPHGAGGTGTYGAGGTGTYGAGGTGTYGAGAPAGRTPAAAGDRDTAPSPGTGPAALHAYPDEAAASEGPTGIGLVEQELGGRIIDETS